jgi:hypothetical protein
MNLLKKTYLSTALAAVLAGGGVPGYVGAVTLSQDNIGDVGIGPYYTMRDGWATDFYIINTSNHTVAAKVRFHEARNSREVLDFTVVLSPYDMINAFAVVDPNLGPVLKFPQLNSEKTCVVPIPTGRQGGVGGYLPFSAFEYTGGNYDNWPADEDYSDYPLGKLDRTLEGYFTVIEEGHSDGGPIYQAAIAKDCEYIEDAFIPATPEGIIPVYEEFDRNMNALKVGFSLTNFERGTQGAGSATMLANFATKRSAISHTMTSILAGAVDVEDLQAKVVAAEADQDDARGDVEDAKANLCQYEIGDATCGFYAVIAGTPPVNDPVQQSCGGIPDFTADPRILNGVDNPTAAQVDATGCPESLRSNYKSSLVALAAADAAVVDAVQARNDAVVGILGAPKNLIHAQTGQWEQGDPERFPNLNSGDFFGYWFVDYEYKWVGNYGELPDAINLPLGLWLGLYPRPVDAVTALLMKSDAINEWAFNPNTGASSDLILTGPTKRWYTDWRNVYDKNGHLNGISPILANYIVNVDKGWPPFSQQFSTLGRSCDTVDVAIWNNDEIGPGGPRVPSPSPDVRLCWEANVLYTGDESVLASEVGVRIDPNDPIYGINTPNANERYNGWMDVYMAVSATNYHPAIPLLNLTLPNIPEFWPVDEIVQVGMPYIGFAFKERDLGVPANAYSGLTPHSYLRLWDKRNLAGGTITLEDLSIWGPVFPNSVASWFCGVPDPIVDDPNNGFEIDCDLYNPFLPIDNTPEGDGLVVPELPL